METFFVMPLLLDSILCAFAFTVIAQAHKRFSRPQGCFQAAQLVVRNDCNGSRVAAELKTHERRTKDRNQP